MRAAVFAEQVPDPETGAEDAPDPPPHAARMLDAPTLNKNVLRLSTELSICLFLFLQAQ
jgi:hypothetical protein